MIQTNFVWDWRKRTRGNAPGPVEIRVTVNRKIYYIGTGVRCTRSQWKANHISGSGDDAGLNDRLSLVLHIVNSYLNECIENHADVDVMEARRRVYELDRKNEAGGSPMLDWLAAQTDTLNLKGGTLKHYDTLKRRLDEFGKLRRWEDLTVELIYEWDAWLHGLAKPQTKAAAKMGLKPEKLSDGAVYNYHKCLKALINRAVKVGKIDANPYDRIRGEFRRGDRENVEYLTEDDMRKFCELRLPPGSPSDVAHDLFIFQMFTGLSYSDTQSFDFSRYKNVGGKWVHTGERVKTGVPFVSRLLPPAVRVLEKYGWETPKMGNADYNRHLKYLGVVADISCRMHSHLARHTFATYMLRNGARIESVSRMLGHTNITQTQRYAKVLAQSVHDDFDMIAEKMAVDDPRLTDNIKME